MSLSEPNRARRRREPCRSPRSRTVRGAAGGAASRPRRSRPSSSSRSSALSACRWRRCRSCAWRTARAWSPAWRRARWPPRSCFGLGWAVGGAGAGHRAGVRRGGRARRCRRPRSVSCARASSRRAATSASASPGARSSRRPSRRRSSGPGPSLSAEVAARFDRMIPAAARVLRALGSRRRVGGRGCGNASRPRGSSPQSYLWGILGALWVLGGAIAFYLGARRARPGADGRRRPVRGSAGAGRRGGPLRGGGRGFRPAAGGGAPGGGQPAAAASGLVFCGRPLYHLPLLPEVVPGPDSPDRSCTPWSPTFPINVGVALLGLFDWYVDFRRRGEGVVEKS